MKSIKTEIIINAPIAIVWNHLTDFASYAVWNPFIHTKGELKLGEQLENTMHIDGQKPQVFKPVITELVPGKRFAWLGSLFVKGLFDGAHYFQLEELGSYKTRLVHGERFSGLLSGVIMSMIEEKTIKGFECMNEALKERSEMVAANK